MEINILFIWHDCFVISLPDCVIVTDYWLDAPQGKPINAEFPEFLSKIPSYKPLYVLVSHHHKDHFVKSVFIWSRRFHNIRYILSKDTAKFTRHLFNPASSYAGVYSIAPELVTVLNRGEVYTDSLLSIKAYGSTDIGNSYLIDYKGYKLFHAGDLNAWIWKDESTDAEVRKALADFQAILNSIKSESPYINVAFFPVDSRIGTDYFTGAQMFVNQIMVEYFFAMHFCLAENPMQLKHRIADATDVSKYHNDSFGFYPKLTTPYESINLTLQKRNIK